MVRSHILNARGGKISTSELITDLKCGEVVANYLTGW